MARTRNERQQGRPTHAIRSELPVGTFTPQTTEGMQAEGWRNTNTWQKAPAWEMTVP